MANVLNGREVSVAAVMTWLEGLPDDFQFSRPGKVYTCDCLVGRYVNQDDLERYGVGFSNIQDYQLGKVLHLDEEVAPLVAIYDAIEAGSITAAEVRRRLALLLLHEVLA